MRQIINMVYVDDKIDPVLSKYLSKYKHDEVDITYDEIRFDNDTGYEGLLCDNMIKRANVVLIDSQLFVNNKVVKGKYTGEQFKLILKKVFPYIEVIVITQNEIYGEFSSTIKKYSINNIESEDEYYGKELYPIINKAINDVCEYRNIVSNMNSNSEIDYMVDKIRNSLDGVDTYDELKKTDIDSLIKSFKNIQESIEGGL